MELIAKIVVVWLSVDTLLISTGWYATITLSQLWPDWWRRVIAETTD